jgi:hypothetical protein
MCLETSAKITFFNPYKFAKGSIGKGVGKCFGIIGHFFPSAIEKLKAYNLQ